MYARAPVLHHQQPQQHQLPGGHMHQPQHQFYNINGPHQRPQPQQPKPQQQQKQQPQGPHIADSPPQSSSGASSQHPSPNGTPPLMTGPPPVSTNFYMPMPMTIYQQQQHHQPIQPHDSGYASQLGSLTNSPASSISSEHQQFQHQLHQHQHQQLPGDQLSAAGLVMQPPLQPLLLPFGLPMPFAAATAAAAAAAAGGGPLQSLPPLPPLPPQFQQLLFAPPLPQPLPQPQQQQQQQQQQQHHSGAAAAAAAFLQHHHQQQQQHQLTGCPVFEQDLPDSCRLLSAPAFRAYNFGSHVPPFDLVKWYSEKPPFILDGKTACLYKMREIDRKLPANMVLSADAEYNTILAEYYILRNMFGPDYSLHDNIFIKLNRSKEGELAKFIHIFFRERQDAEVYMANAHKFGALTPAWSNPRAFSRNNVYITSVPFYLLSKESLCGYVRDFVLGKAAAVGPGQDPIKRARVDAEKRSAQVEFHRSEDAEALIAYFYQHIPEANARPAFDNAKEQRASESGAAPAACEKN